MLKEIFQALRGKDVLVEMIGQVGQMLDIGQWMFDKASEVLMRQSEWETVADELYARDRQINEIEQTVRERIITHLSLGHQADLSACLVLMSVVKDAERIGDYGKNIFEVGKFYRNAFTHRQYAAPLEEIRGSVRPLFAQAKGAFLQADKNLARVVLEDARGLTKSCDLIIQQLLSVHEQIAPNEAVAYVLMARFYKRVTAHLANISTSVVSPVPMLDYRGKMPDVEPE